MRKILSNKEQIVKAHRVIFTQWRIYNKAHFPTMNALINIYEILSQKDYTLKRSITCSNLVCLYTYVNLHYLKGHYIVFQIVAVEVVILLFVHIAVEHWIKKSFLLIDSFASWTSIFFELFILSVPKWAMIH